MTVTLDACAAAFRDGHARIHAALDGRTPAEANRRPEAGVWSPLEVVAHLNTLAADYLPALERAVAAAPRGSSETVRLGRLGGVFVRAVGPQGRPSRTLASMRPPGSGTPAGASDLAMGATLAAFDVDTVRFLSVVEAARHVEADRVRVASPFLRLLRLPLGAFLAGLGGHVQRHAAQIEARI